MQLKNILLVLAGCLLLASCLKDKGNNDYRPLTKVSTDLDKQEVTVYQFDTLRMKSNLTGGDLSTMKFSWILSSSADGFNNIRLDAKADLATLITVPAGSYYLDFFGKDTVTGVTTTARVYLTVLSAFNEGWLVVENRATGSDISLIDPKDSVLHNIYSKVNPTTPLSANIQSVSVFKRSSKQFIYALASDGGTQINSSSFLVEGSMKDWFFVMPSQDRNCQLYMPCSLNETMLVNGRPYSMSLMVPAPYKLGLAPTGNYYMLPFDFSFRVSGVLMYDSVQQRFNVLDSYSGEIAQLPAAKAGAIFDLNHIGKRMLFGESRSSTTQVAFSLLQNNNNDSLFVYNFWAVEFNSTPLAINVVKNAPGIANADAYKLSPNLPHIFYAKDNLLYLLDIPAGTARLAYTFPAGTKVAAITISTTNTNRLVVGTNQGDQGTVYIFDITSTGDFTGSTYSKVLKGFGKIKNITYKPAP